MRALSIAASGMQAQQLNVDVISHNIANMNTTSYKRQRAEFQDMLYQNLERPGATSSASGGVLPLGIQLGVGVRADAVGRITEQGGISATGNPYDLAINGRGYFQITMPSGQTGYTRAGNLAVNADGQMVTADGYPIGHRLQCLLKRPRSKSRATASSKSRSPARPIPNRLTSSKLHQSGGSRRHRRQLVLKHLPPARQPQRRQLPGLGTLMQGYLENSNVNASKKSFTIVAQRAYEMNARVITAADEMLQATTQLR
jgi:flagellar basal-body rod protein FlgG